MHENPRGERIKSVNWNMYKDIFKKSEKKESGTKETALFLYLQWCDFFLTELRCDFFFWTELRCEIFVLFFWTELRCKNVKPHQ